MRFWTCLLALGVAVGWGNASLAFDLDWDGGDGMWFSQFSSSFGGNWNGQQNVYDLVGRENGHEGYRDATGTADILIASGSKVSYDASTVDEEFRVMQGSTLTISGGAVWEQKTLDTDETHPQFSDLERWEETWATYLDPSHLNLDNGTFRRTGAATFDPADAGGGAMIFGSWKGDDNFGDRDGDGDTDGADFLAWQRTNPPPPRPSDLRKILGTYGASPNVDQINVSLTNGGSLENEGQIWFGSQEVFPIEINININGGSTLKAIGGLDASLGPAGKIIPGADASIVIFDWDNGNVDLTIDFTGPGSIMTDEGAIHQVSLNGGSPTVTDMSYEDLWNAGILTANGGNTGTFADHFTVTGLPGDAIYTLISTVASTPITATVPEPTSLFLGISVALSLPCVRRRRVSRPIEGHLVDRQLP